MSQLVRYAQQPKAAALMNQNILTPQRSTGLGPWGWKEEGEWASSHEVLGLPDGGDVIGVDD